MNHACRAHRRFSRIRQVPPLCSPRNTYASFGPPESTTQSVSRAVQPFCRAHWCDRPTDRQTDRPRYYSVGNSRPHASTYVVLLCGLIIRSKHLTTAISVWEIAPTIFSDQTATFFRCKATLCLKNVPPLACYNFDMSCERILIFLAEMLTIK